MNSIVLYVHFFVSFGFFLSFCFDILEKEIERKSMKFGGFSGRELVVEEIPYCVELLKGKKTHKNKMRRISFF